MTPPAPAAASSTRPPGPPGRWLSGNLRAFRDDRLGFVTACARDYGDVAAFRVGPKRIWLVSHPDLIEEVLVHQNRRVTKHFGLRRAQGTLGQGLLTSEGEFWRRQRRLSQPAFHRDRIAAYGAVMVEFTERMLATWAPGQRRDAHADMMQLTLEIVCKTLFDADIGGASAGLAGAMEALMANFTERINRIVQPPSWLPVPSNRRFHRALGQVEGLLAHILAERRRSGADRGDLLSMLLHAQDAEGDGTGMSDRQLRDELVTLFLAGHETTANTLAWIWYLLSAHPEAESRLHAELDGVLEDGRPPAVADLPRLPYADAVVTEALRILPTVWLVGREAREPVELGGYTAPVGTTFFMSQWVVHRDPRWYDEPEAFRPDRWLDGGAARRPRYAYFPFGGGPRVCIGNHFAQMEAVLLLAAIARRYRPRVAPGAVIHPNPTMTLRPDGGVPVVLEERRRG